MVGGWWEGEAGSKRENWSARLERSAPRAAPTGPADRRREGEAAARSLPTRSDCAPPSLPRLLFSLGGENLHPPRLPSYRVMGACGSPPRADGRHSKTPAIEC